MKKYFLGFIFLLLPSFLFSYQMGDFKVGSNDLIESITATSTLDDSRNRYVVTNVLDKTYRSWSEGVEGPGIMEVLRIKFKEYVSIESISIKNGYGDYNYYAHNNRVKDIFVTCGPIEFRATLHDNPGMQDIIFSDPIITDQMSILIESVYPGFAYDDTCISEIKINGLDNSDNSLEFNTFVDNKLEDIADMMDSILSTHYGFNSELRYEDGQDLLLRHILEPIGYRDVLHILTNGVGLFHVRIQSEWLKDKVSEPDKLPVFIDQFFTIDNKNVEAKQFLYPDPFEYCLRNKFERIASYDDNLKEMQNLIKTIRSIANAIETNEPINYYLNTFNDDYINRKVDISSQLLNREKMAIDELGFNFNVINDIRLYKYRYIEANVADIIFL